MFYTRSSFSFWSTPKQISTPQQHQQIAFVRLPSSCAPARPTHGKDINFYATSLPTNVHKRIIKQKHFPIIVITINSAYRTKYSAWDSGCALFAHCRRPTNSTHIFKAMRQDAMINCSHTLPFQPFNGDAGNKLSGNKHPRKMQLPAGQSGQNYEREYNAECALNLWMSWCRRVYFESLCKTTLNCLMSLFGRLVMQGAQPLNETQKQ